jgi:D-glycero-D-manno-heptose 1,7-bisphosphate phosphatase
MPPRWVFLDRDGTLNVSPPTHEYVTDPAAVELLPGAGQAVARLNRAGAWVGVVTNQRGVARGLLTPERLDAIHTRLRAELAGHGALLDGIWVCPHEEGECECRKPHPGLLLQAQRDVPGLRLAEAALIGDTESDIAAGRAAGVLTVRIGLPGDIGDADLVAADLAAAVELLLVG